MAAADEDSLLGKLPRSRPGNRSAKRGAGAPRRPARPPTPQAAASKPRPAQPAAASKNRRAQPAARSGDPLSVAARTAVGIADTGLKAASALSREALRRLPRP